MAYQITKIAALAQDFTGSSSSAAFPASILSAAVFPLPPFLSAPSLPAHHPARFVPGFEMSCNSYGISLRYARRPAIHTKTRAGAGGRDVLRTFEQPLTIRIASSSRQSGSAALRAARDARCATDRDWRPGTAPTGLSCPGASGPRTAARPAR